MKSKVDPRLLIVLGVAVVLVAGFAATKLFGGADEAAPAATETGELSDATEGGEPLVDGIPVVADQGDTGSSWGERANAICGKAVADLLTREPLTTPEAAADALGRGADILDELAALPAPPGAEADASEFVALLQSSLDAVDELVASESEGDLEQLGSFLEQQALAQARLEQLAPRLGAEGCLSGAAGSQDESVMAQAALGSEPGMAGLAKLQTALQKNDSVVLVVYSPSAELDTRVVREARAGANGGGAGFVAVNGLREAHVKALVEAFNLRETPATLVVSQGLIVSSQFSGFADRETVAQAVRDSLGPS